MLYSVLIYEAPGLAGARTTEQQRQVLEAHRNLQRDAKRRGAFVSAVQLSESGASTLRRRRKNTWLTDGPFADTRELFVGFYIFNCEDFTEALRYARRIPVSEMGCVEVRPVVYGDSRDLDV